MAYGLIYKSDFRDENKVSGTTYIYKSGYTGDVTDLKLIDISLRNSLDGNIFSTGLDMTIINDFADWTELDDLLGNYEKQYKCKVVKNGETIFEGFLICDLNEQNFKTLINMVKMSGFTKYKIGGIYGSCCLNIFIKNN